MSAGKASPGDETSTIGPRAQAVAVATDDSAIAPTVDRLLALALRGIPRMRATAYAPFAQTTRLVGDSGPELRREGTNTRYGAIVALGASRLSESAQRSLLNGQTARMLAGAVTTQALSANEPGAIALAAWAGAEIGGVRSQGEVMARLVDLVAADAITATVDTAWVLTALLAGPHVLGDASLADRVAERLMSAQGTDGIFPHVLPPGRLPWARSHVGCFADQVYPIQALARYYAATGRVDALDAANRCARQICDLQGPDGQWWWHYDARTGQVVEGYPVYSVHQHAMAPMALLELEEAGGIDCSASIAAGLQWLESRPESRGVLVRDDLGVVWRKVGRREPRKVVRYARSTATALHPRLRLRWLDRIFPATEIDYECRPYELGWLLYAWLAQGVVTELGTVHQTLSASIEP
jgi:hypothetical protein